MRYFDVTYASTITDMVVEINQRIEKGEMPIGAIQYHDNTHRYSQSILCKTPNTKEDSQNDTQQIKDSISLLEKVYDYMLNGAYKHYDVDDAEADLKAALAKLNPLI